MWPKSLNKVLYVVTADSVTTQAPSDRATGAAIVIADPTSIPEATHFPSIHSVGEAIPTGLR
ncbi:MAG: hypothetical protein JAZ02_08255 [Candidatus Thiodiazotropha endolucinida]|nr:hypothetical protein [Candidatus Thiodiazotropha endolucinida]